MRRIIPVRLPDRNGKFNCRLTLVSYRATCKVEAYIEPVAVGAALPDMPLFPDENGYVDVPLEATYMSAFAGVPKRRQHMLTE